MNLIQEQVADTKQATEDAIIDAINAIKLATANPKADAALLDQARAFHREAQYMWDFVSAEDSTGFHNPEYALKILAESTNLARQCSLRAVQAVRLLQAAVPILVAFTAPFYTRPDPGEDDFFRSSVTS